MSKRLASATVILWLAASGTGLGATKSLVPAEIEQAWFRLTGTLDPLDPSALHDRTDELLQVAARLELTRLSPYAQALVLRTRTLPPQAQETVLREALRLDPRSTEALFALASLQLRRFQVNGVWTTARALGAYANDGRLVNFRRGSGAILAVVVFGALGSLWGLFTTARALPRLWHDLMELASAWRLGANAWVFASFLLGLPLFLALDPIWLLFWLFALTWAYFSTPAKVLGGVLLAFFALASVWLELAFRQLTHPPDPITRAAWALAEQRYDPLVLVELDTVEELFADDPVFYRLRGDVERQFGLFEASLLSYQEGLRLRSGDPALLAAAGTVHYLQGNYGAAVQLLSEARDRGFDPVIVNFNLSLAFAHLYNFRDSDQAIAAARKASETRLRQLTRGRDSQVIIQNVSLEEAQGILDRRDPVLLLNHGLLPPPLARKQRLFAPLTLAPVLGLLLAFAHYFLRARATGFALACTKCGRTFCARCKLSRESQSYCTQCINIFLKRDMVAPELQIAKHRQLQRRRLLHRTLRRVADVFVPGLGHALYGRALLGTVLMVPAAFLSVAAAFWLPAFVEPLTLQADLTPIRLLFVLLWLGLLAFVQLRKDRER